ncbi:MAG: lysoplasmalogenase family protein [Microbacterium sp.]|uniref:lysoplasmalogenase family protein n=1 Tax=Microbacterium sp. TaxID=51671 RepID=UPI0039E3BD27
MSIAAFAIRTRWWGFAPFTAVSVLHVLVLGAGADALAQPTKLLLMPLLALGVLWAGNGSGWGAPFTLLFIALAFSWLGDGAATFFPFAPPLPLMLGCFAAAHLAYIVLFTRHLARQPFPRWSAVYLLWWMAMLVVLGAVLIPQPGGLGWLVAVGAYGVLLGFTAASAARGTPAIASGGVLFLCSDSILAFRVFLPDAMPGWTGPLVMLAYCAGQGLLAAGAVMALVHGRGRR